MSWDFSNFAEGDSGVPMTPPGRYISFFDDIESGRRLPPERPAELVSMDVTAFLAEVAGRAMAIAKNKENDPLARATALDVARKSAMDQITLGGMFQK